MMIELEHLPVLIETKKEYDDCYELFITLLDLRRTNTIEDNIKLSLLHEIIGEYEKTFTYGCT